MPNKEIILYRISMIVRPGEDIFLTVSPIVYQETGRTYSIPGNRILKDQVNIVKVQEQPDFVRYLYHTPNPDPELHKTVIYDMTHRARKHVATSLARVQEMNDMLKDYNPPYEPRELEYPWAPDLK